MLELNKIYCGEAYEIMSKFPDDCIDLTVTSPPYDNLRDYKGYIFDFERIARDIYRVTKDGGVVVWIVGDATIKGSETGTSFKQALYFKEIGFNIHDTMIWKKPTFTDTGSLKTRYGGVFEYMFVFVKGKIKTFNPIKDRKNKYFGDKKHGRVRQVDGSTKPQSSLGKLIPEYGQRFNVWSQSPQRQVGGHPAPFPEKLIEDHIKSWSNEGDIVLDPMCGSGTTCKMAQLNNRNFIGIEISEEYCKIANERIRTHNKPLFNL